MSLVSISFPPEVIYIPRSELKRLILKFRSPTNFQAKGNSIEGRMIGINFYHIEEEKERRRNDKKFVCETKSFLYKVFFEALGLESRERLGGAKFGGA